MSRAHDPHEEISPDQVRKVDGQARLVLMEGLPRPASGAEEKY